MKKKNFPLGQVDAHIQKTAEEQSAPTGTPKVPGKLYWVPGDVGGSPPQHGSWQYIDDKGNIKALRSINVV